MFLVQQVLLLQKTQEPVVVEQVNTFRMGSAHFAHPTQHPLVAPINVSVKQEDIGPMVTVLSVQSTHTANKATHPAPNVLQTQHLAPDQRNVDVKQEGTGLTDIVQSVLPTPTALKVLNSVHHVLLGRHLIQDQLCALAKQGNTGREEAV